MPVRPAGSPASSTPASSQPRPQTTPEAPPRSTPSSHPCCPTHIATRSLQILLAGIFAMGTLLALLPAAGHDQLWFLLMAHRWLSGATLYGPEIFDSNTPAIIWLSAIPDLLGRLLHLPSLLVPACAKLLVLALLLALAILSGRLIRRLAPGLTRPALLWLAAVFTALTVCAPARDFGQRDALAAALLLPYLLAAAASARTLRPASSVRIASALLAAVGICLKPHQALVPIAVELTVLLLNRRRLPAVPVSTRSPSHPLAASSAPVEHAEDRPLTLLHRLEPLLLVLSGLLFLAAVRLLTPLFFSLTLPTLAATYWAVGDLSPWELLAQAPQLTVLFCLAPATLVWASRRWRPLPSAPVPGSTLGSTFSTAQILQDLRRPTLLLLVAGLASTAAYFLQGTGWYYQQLPAITFFGLALALTLIPLAATLPQPRWLPVATASLALLAVALTSHFSGLPLRRASAYNAPIPDPTLFETLAPGTPVAILTTSVEDSMMPTWRWHLTWSQRTNNLWTLPAILRNHDLQHPPPPRHRLSPAELTRLSAQQRRWMTEDMLRWHPALILVEQCQNASTPCQELGPLHPDLLAFFLDDPTFRTLFVSHYRVLRRTANYTAYTLSASW